MRIARKRRGEMREKIVIQSVNPTTDGQGGMTEGTPVTVATMWAKVSPFSASRTLKYAQVAGSQGYEITFNYRGDITINEKNLIAWNSKSLAIHSVRMIDENRTQFSILAYEKT